MIRKRFSKEGPPELRPELAEEAVMVRAEEYEGDRHSYFHTCAREEVVSVFVERYCHDSVSEVEGFEPRRHGGCQYQCRAPEGGTWGEGKASV